MVPFHFIISELIDDWHEIFYKKSFQLKLKSPFRSRWWKSSRFPCPSHTPFTSSTTSTSQKTIRHRRPARSRKVERRTNTATCNTVANSRRANITSISLADINSELWSYLSRRWLLFSHYQYLISLRSHSHETEGKGFVLTYFCSSAVSHRNKNFLIKMKSITRWGFCW